MSEIWTVRMILFELALCENLQLEIKTEATIKLVYHSTCIKAVWAMGYDSA